MDLRPYQQEAVSNVLETWREGVDRTLLVLPTGCGKTIVFCRVIEEVMRGEATRCLILAHRAELLDQAADKYQRLTGMSVAMEKAQETCLGSWYNTVVGSVQSFSERRLERFPHDYFSHIVIDEAHHTLASTYMRVLDHSPQAKVLGVTATADRGDKRNLGSVYKNIAFEMTIRRASEEGWLCRIQALTLPVSIALAAPRSGDWSERECASAIEPYLEDIAAKLAEYASDRKTVVFLPLIATAQRFRELCEANGLQAREINGQSQDRSDTLAWFHDAPKGSVLCNSMLLTEGWDEPSVDCIAVLRPTKVRALYVQMVGRGTRLHPGKDNLLLLDFLWHTERHALCRPAHLVCRNEELQSRISELMAERTGGEGTDLLEATDESESSAREEREESLRKLLEEQRKKQKRLVDPLQYEASIGKEHLNAWEPDPTRISDYMPMTDRQRATLENMGIDPSGVTCAGHASHIIDILVARRSDGLSTPKQIRCLERFGFRNVGTWTFAKASGMITRLATSGWRLPRGVNPSEF